MPPAVPLSTSSLPGSGHKAEEHHFASPKEGEAISWQMFCRDVLTGEPEVSAKGTEHAMALVLGQGSSKESLSLVPPSRRRDSCKHPSSKRSQGQGGRLLGETWSEEGA